MNVTGAAGRVKLRLFLEHIEIPVIAAQITVEPNAPAVAAIQIPPLEEATRFLPRTLVHLFFHDTYEASNPMLSYRGDVASQAKDPTIYEVIRRNSGSNRAVDFLDGQDPDLLNEHFKLCFTGDLMAFQVKKTPNGRQIVLQCQDHSNYWDQAQQFNNTDLFGPGMSALFSGGSTNLFTDFLDEPGGVIAHLIQSPSTQYPALKGLLGGIVHLLEAMGGSYYQGKTYAGQNIFFSVAELRLHITQMITAFEKDPTGQRLLNAGGFGDMLGRSLGQIGSQASFRDCINMLMRHIFHETYAQPCPLFVPGTEGTISGVVRRRLKEDPKYAYVTQTTARVRSRLYDLVRQLVLSGTPDGDPRFLNNAMATIDELRKICKTTAAELKKSDFPSVAQYFQTTDHELAQIVNQLKLKWKPGVSEEQIRKFQDMIGPIEARMKQVDALDVPKTPKKEARPARLNSQIFRPDTWFSAPPRCNVIFPDQYTLSEYARSFVEPTRLLLKTIDSFFGEDELFDSFYFAPKAFGVKKNKRDLQTLLQNDIFEHELYTGIIPVFEKMGEVNIFGARAGAINGTTAKVGMAQRSANFLYFKHRFANRRMNVEMRFNPYLVAGFPAVVLDRQVDLDAYQRQSECKASALGVSGAGLGNLEDGRIGTHFLGNIQRLTHMLDQSSGGQTQIELSYARQHDEGVEFLGAIRDDQNVERRVPGDAVKEEHVAALRPPVVGGLGPNFGTIQSVTDVTSRYAPNVDRPEPIELPLYVPRRSGTERAEFVAVGVKQEARMFGPQSVALAGGMNNLIQFRAYKVMEEVPRYRREKIDMPAEEYIRPGWYGDCWSPGLIGEAYQAFFRTGSITDPVQVADSQGAVTGLADQELVDAMTTAFAATGPSDPRAVAPAILALDKGASVEQAVDFIVHLYSYVKQSGQYAENLIRAYTWRPIATMVDIFGSDDLRYDEDGLAVIAGVEGFHSRASGPYEDLFGLVTPEIEKILGLKRGTIASKRIDTRKRKQDAVLAYATQLRLHPASLG
jgi:hypothetical protein